MIHSFSLKNFASFKEEAFIDLESPKSFYKKTFSEFNKNINKVLMVIGHNASGKTTILKGISFLAWLMSNSFSLSPEENFPIASFFYNKKLSKFKIKFSLNNKLYHYEVELNSVQIFKEQFFIIDNGNKRVIFNYNIKSPKELCEIDKDFLPYKVAINKKSSIISLARQHQSQWAIKICDYLESWKTNISQQGKSFVNHDNWDNFTKVGKWYYDNPLFLKVANKIFEQLDLGFKGLDIMPLQNPVSKKTEYLTYGYHQINDGEQEEILLLDESHGTQSLFYLLNKVFPVLKNGGVAILDEFDNELHSHMLPLLFNLFYNTKLNPNNGQLIFSSHHHQILESMNKSQVYFVEKPSFSQSQINRLDKIKRVKYGPKLLKTYYNKLLKKLN